MVVRVNHGRRAAVRVEQDIRLLFELRVLDRSVFVGQIELLENQRHLPRIRSRSQLVDDDGLEVRHGAKCEWERGGGLLGDFLLFQAPECMMIWSSVCCFIYPSPQSTYLLYLAVIASGNDHFPNLA